MSTLGLDEDGKSLSAEVVKQRTQVSWRVLNLLSFVFNWDNYVTLPVLYLRITGPVGASKAAWGWTGASFSLAALVASGLFGALAAKFGAKRPLIVAQLLMIIGDIFFYLNLQSLWNVIFGRLLAGFAAGSRTTCLWYIAMTTTGEERGKVIGNWYAVGMFGMIFGPALSSIFLATLPEPGPETNVLDCNRYNAPAVSSIVLHTLSIVLLVYLFHDTSSNGGEGEVSLLESADRDIETDPAETDNGGDGDVVENGGDASGADLSPPTGVWPLLICQFLLVFAINTFESLIVPLFTTRFASAEWTPAAVMAAVGFIVFIAAVVEGILTAACKIHERKIEIWGIFVFLIGCLMSLDLVSMSLAGKMTFEILSTILIAAGFTFAFCAQPALMAKLIIASHGGALIPSMGKFMAWLSMAASGAKVGAPLAAGYGLDLSSGNMALNIVVAVIICAVALSLLLYAVFWRHLLEENHNSPGEFEHGLDGDSEENVKAQPSFAKRTMTFDVMATRSMSRMSMADMAIAELTTVN